MTQPADMFDPATNDEYMPSRRVPDARAYFDAWERESAAVRARQPPQEYAYGPGKRERLDVFEPAAGARATLLFIHGGYWQAFDRGSFSYLAPPLVGAGIRVAIMGYDLTPTVRLERIVWQARQAAAAVAGQFPGPLVVAGHSAGAHLAAAIHTADWAAEGLPQVELAAGIGVSGLYELGPLRRTELQPALQLSAQEARALSPALHRPSNSAPFVTAVGEQESSAFLWQSQRLVDAWPGVASGVHLLPGRHHFDAPDELLGLALSALD